MCVAAEGYGKLCLLQDTGYVDRWVEPFACCFDVRAARFCPAQGSFFVYHLGLLREARLSLEAEGGTKSLNLRAVCSVTPSCLPHLRAQ